MPCSRVIACPSAQAAVNAPSPAVALAADLFVETTAIAASRLPAPLDIRAVGIQLARRLDPLGDLGKLTRPDLRSTHLEPKEVPE